jgi:hypothetical protein
MVAIELREPILQQEASEMYDRLSYVSCAVQLPRFELLTHVPSALRERLLIMRIERPEHARDFLHKHGYRIVGVEIAEGAQNVDDDPWTGRTAVMMGNEVSECLWHSIVSTRRSTVPVGPNSSVCATSPPLYPQGTGMSERQMAICDGFVYVSQFGVGTGSLNVCVAGSIVMHRFFLWNRQKR